MDPFSTSGARSRSPGGNRELHCTCCWEYNRRTSLQLRCLVGGWEGGDDTAARRELPDSMTSDQNAIRLPLLRRRGIGKYTGKKHVNLGWVCRLVRGDLLKRATKAEKKYK